MADLGADVTGMLDNVEATVRYLAAKFGFTDVGGTRKSDPFPDHPGGYAADFMIKNSGQGDQLATFASQNAGGLAVDYIIWNRKVWDADKDQAGLPWSQWRTYTGTSNPHTDHVHITFRKTGSATLVGLKDGITNTVGKLFDLDAFMNQVQGTTITLGAATLGVVLLGIGVVLTVRSTAQRAVKSTLGGTS